MFQTTFFETVQASKSFSHFFQPAVIAAFIAAAVALPSVFLGWRNLKIQRLDSERREIYKKLNDFYGPMRMLLRTSYEFSLLLKKGKEDLKREDEKNFRVLTYLIRGNKFNISDTALLQKIISDGKKMERVILNNAGLIDDDGLHSDLNELLTHIRLIRMAAKGEFETGADKHRPYDNKVFPRSVNHVIDEKFFQFKLRLEILNKNKNKQVLNGLRNKISESRAKAEKFKGKRPS